MGGIARSPRRIGVLLGAILVLCAVTAVVVALRVDSQNSKVQTTRLQLRAMSTELLCHCFGASCDGTCIAMRAGAGQYLDSWGLPITATVNQRTIILASAGPDGVHGGRDDLVYRRACVDRVPPEQQFICVRLLRGGGVVGDAEIDGGADP